MALNRIRSARAAGAALLLAAGAAGAATIAVPVFDVHATAMHRMFNVAPRGAWLSDDEFVALWMQLGPGSVDQNARWDVMLRRFDGTGAPLAAPVRITSAHRSWSLDDVSIRVLDDGRFVVSWPDADDHPAVGHDLYAQVFAADGTPATLRFAGNVAFEGTQVYPNLAPLPNGRFASFYRATGPLTDGADVFAQRFHGTGRPFGSPVPLNTVTAGLQSRPAGDCGARKCFAAWASSPNAASGPFELKGRFLDATLAATSEEFAISPSGTDASFASVAMAPTGAALVAWAVGNPSEALYFSLFRPDQTLRTGPVQINPAGTIPASAPRAAVHSTGEFGIAWSQGGGGRSKILFKDFAATGASRSTVRVADFPDTAALATVSHVAVSPGGRVLVLWKQVDPGASVLEAATHKGAILDGIGLVP